MWYLFMLYSCSSFHCFIIFYCMTISQPVLFIVDKHMGFQFLTDINVLVYIF